MHNLPKWMTKTEDYVPPSDGGTFYYKTLGTLGHVMSRIKAEGGREGRIKLPAALKLILMLGLIILLSVSQNMTVIMAVTALALMRLALMPARDISSVVKVMLVSGALAVIIFIPAVVLDPSRLMNSLRVILKIVISVSLVGIFGHTTQWNHITGALRTLKVPGVVVFIIDITFRYIVLLGNYMISLLESLKLRSVGRNSRKYNSVGGVMGVTFIRGTEMNREMYEAMVSRGFTDDYRGL